MNDPQVPSDAASSAAKSNIALIGMPGAGKSSVGVVLAKSRGMEFLDSDLLIQSQTGKLLSELITEHGVEGFWRIEEQINSAIDVQNHVIATGGSVIYGPKAIEHLKSIGTVIYLKLQLRSLTRRLGSLEERGVTLKPGQRLSDLYAERIPLYEAAADLVIDCQGLSIRKVIAEINRRLDGESR